MPDQSVPIQDDILGALGVVLDYVDLVGQKQAILSRVKSVSHIQWTSGDSEHEYPEPDFIVAGEGFNSHAPIEAVVLMMRYPGPYDGGVEFMYERLLGSAIRLLFNSSRVAFLRSVVASITFFSSLRYNLVRLTSFLPKSLLSSLFVSVRNGFHAVSYMSYPLLFQI